MFNCKCIVSRSFLNNLEAYRLVIGETPGTEQGLAVAF
jgi:hypothetical protein